MTDGTGSTRPIVDVGRWLDLAIYAPIGLLTLAQKELPGLISSGRERVDNQLTLAKFMGQMAVKQGKRSLQRRLDEAAARRNTTPTSGDVIEAELAADPAPLPLSLPEAIIEAVAEAPQLHTDDPLPIDGYDSLAASQVVMRLASLTPAELDLIRMHEESHRARRTILGKISQLQGR